jgi:hypothetical protein
VTFGKGKSTASFQTRFVYCLFPDYLLVNLMSVSRLKNSVLQNYIRLINAEFSFDFWRQKNNTVTEQGPHLLPCLILLLLHPLCLGNVLGHSLWSWISVLRTLSFRLGIFHFFSSSLMFSSLYYSSLFIPLVRSCLSFKSLLLISFTDSIPSSSCPQML